MKLTNLNNKRLNTLKQYIKWLFFIIILIIIFWGVNRGPTILLKTSYLSNYTWKY